MNSLIEFADKQVWDAERWMLVPIGDRLSEGQGSRRSSRGGRNGQNENRGGHNQNQSNQGGNRGGPNRNRNHQYGRGAGQHENRNHPSANRDTQSSYRDDNHSDLHYDNDRFDGKRGGQNRGGNRGGQHRGGNRGMHSNFGSQYGVDQSGYGNNEEGQSGATNKGDQRRGGQHSQYGVDQSGNGYDEEGQSGGGNRGGQNRGGQHRGGNRGGQNRGGNQGMQSNFGSQYGVDQSGNGYDEEGQSGGGNRGGQNRGGQHRGGNRGGQTMGGNQGMHSNFGSQYGVDQSGNGYDEEGQSGGGNRGGQNRGGQHRGGNTGGQNMGGNQGMQSNFGSQYGVDQSGNGYDEEGQSGGGNRGGQNRGGQHRGGNRGGQNMGGNQGMQSNFGSQYGVDQSGNGYDEEGQSGGGNRGGQNRGGQHRGGNRGGQNRGGNQGMHSNFGSQYGVDQSGNGYDEEGQSGGGNRGGQNRGGQHRGGNRGGQNMGGNQGMQSNFGSQYGVDQSGNGYDEEGQSGGGSRGGQNRGGQHRGGNRGGQNRGGNRGMHSNFGSQYGVDQSGHGYDEEGQSGGGNRGGQNRGGNRGMHSNFGSQYGVDQSGHGYDEEGQRGPGNRGGQRGGRSRGGQSARGNRGAPNMQGNRQDQYGGASQGPEGSGYGADTRQGYGYQKKNPKTKVAGARATKVSISSSDKTIISDEDVSIEGEDDSDSKEIPKETKEKLKRNTDNIFKEKLIDGLMDELDNMCNIGPKSEKTKKKEGEKQDKTTPNKKKDSSQPPSTEPSFVYEEDSKPPMSTKPQQTDPKVTPRNREAGSSSNQHKGNRAKENVDDAIRGPNVNEVFKFLVKKLAAEASPEAIARQSGLFPTDFDVRKWFRSNRNRFTLIERDGEITNVLAFNKAVTYCLDYITKRSCDKSDCNRYHICKDLLCGNCAFGDGKCKFSHDFLDKSTKNLSVSKSFGYDTVFTNSEICSILKVRNPFVCVAWNENATCENAICTGLHICQRFILENCFEDADDCPFSHDKASKHNLPIIEAYRMEKWNDHIFRRMIYIVRNLRVRTTSSESASAMDTMEESMKEQMETADSDAETSSPDRAEPVLFTPGPDILLPIQKKHRTPVKQKTQGTRVGTNEAIRQENRVPASANNQQEMREPAGATANQEREESRGDVKGNQTKQETRVPTGTRSKQGTRKVDNISLSTDNLGSKFFICDGSVTQTGCKSKTCRYAHLEEKMPYIWQINVFGQWLSFPQSEAVEFAYCNKDNTAVTEVERDSNLYRVEVKFDPNLHAVVNMVGLTDGQDFVDVRRLSTPSYMTGKFTSQSYKTQWRWYFQNELRSWELYEPNMQYTLEQKLQAGQKEYLFSRENYRFKYMLSFKTMTQVNLDTGKTRQIIRRPLFVSRDILDRGEYPESLKAPPTVPTPLPPGWAPWDLCHPFEFVKLSPASAAYRDVSESFFKTLSETRYVIDDIFRVQNHVLWSSFCNEEKTMQANLERSGKDGAVVDKRALFHGTDSLKAVQGIATNNFDFRISGKHGTVYGNGAYFARDAKYSNSYTEVRGQERYMFRASVLVGEFTRGQKDYGRPPSKRGNDHELYDSLVDNVDFPTVFVLSDKWRHYPEYLITYHDSTPPDMSDTGLQIPKPPKRAAPGVPPPSTTSPVSSSQPNIGSPTGAYLSYPSAAPMSYPTGTMSYLTGPAPYRGSDPSTPTSTDPIDKSSQFTAAAVKKALPKKKDDSCSIQ